MATIPEPSLFRWDCVDQLGDLERLLLVLDAIPDEPLMQLLERERRNGRNDYPVRPLWNSLLAGFVFGHDSIASLRRELLRNAQLREVCGFDLFKGTAAVPTEYAYTRFQPAGQARGGISAGPSSPAGPAQGTPARSGSLGAGRQGVARLWSKYELAEDEEPDGRRDHDAVRATARRSVGGGYLVHLIVDANYELPVAFAAASYGEQPVAAAGSIAGTTPWSAQCQRLSADKGYDDSKLIERLWDQYGIKPDIRNCWKGDAEEDGVRTKLVNGQENVIYTHDGSLLPGPQTDLQRAMDYGGFERDRNTLKYRCPARYSGTCEGMEQARWPTRCASSARRIFTPVARSSYDLTTTMSAARWSGSTAGWPAGTGLTTRSSAD